MTTQDLVSEWADKLAIQELTHPYADGVNRATGTVVTQRSDIPASV
jgi:hypothetical protein